MNPLLQKPAPRRTGLHAGSEIDCWCTRCKLDLGHRIIALVEQRPKRVVCMTCGSEHNYRAKAETKAPAERKKTTSSRSSSSSSSKKAAAGRSEWEARVSGQALTAFTRYSMDQNFDVDQLVAHKKFGEGFVSMAEKDKVTIVFREGERVLAHNKS